MLCNIIKEFYCKFIFFFFGLISLYKLYFNSLYENYCIIAKGIFVVHAISTPVVMAMMMHTFLIDFQVQCFLIFAIWTMTLFVVCFMGQRMLNEVKLYKITKNKLFINIIYL